MADFPVPLDNLISYVRALHPEEGPLAHLADAVQVATRLDEQSDALIGHFVDQARASGASWSQIGASMGVSKQAAQKRFVLRDDDLALEGRTFSRFAPRARTSLAAAGALAEADGGDAIDTPHLVAALLADPETLAAKAVHRLGVADDAVYEALGVGPATGSWEAGVEALRALQFTTAAQDSLRSALKAALRLGHNYIGTEHLLLGALSQDGETTDRLGAIGLTLPLADSAVGIEVAQVMLEKQQAR